MKMSRRKAPLAFALLVAAAALVSWSCSGTSSTQSEDQGTSASSQESAGSFPYAAAPPLADATATADCQSGQRVSWTDAQAHLNVDVVLFGPVFASQDARGGGIDLSLGDSAKPTQAVLLRIPAGSLSYFDAPPDQLFVGKDVCAFGVIEALNGRLVMVIDSDKSISALSDSKTSAIP
jgi:hypothetical protein